MRLRVELDIAALIVVVTCSGACNERKPDSRDSTLGISNEAECEERLIDFHMLCHEDAPRSRAAMASWVREMINSKEDFAEYFECGNPRWYDRYEICLTTSNEARAIREALDKYWLRKKRGTRQSTPAAAGSGRAAPSLQDGLPATRNTQSVGSLSTVAPVAQVTTSSTHAPAAGYVFDPTNLVDGDTQTSWQAERSDRSPWIHFEFKEELLLAALHLANGFQTVDRFGDEFVNNERIATARIRFSDGTEVPIQIDADTRGFIRFDLPRTSTRSARIIVDTTHAGFKWRDLAVSEVTFVGKPVR